MHGTYNTWLVILSMAVAVLASYVALDLGSHVTATRGTRAARYWLIGGAISMGIGIWSMHFIGMLAFQLPMPMSYHILTTLLSLAIAILAAGFALYIVSSASLRLPRLLGGGVLMGIGIAAMHYTGMAAMEMETPLRYDPLLYSLSILIAITASVAALWIAFQLRAETILSAFWRKAGSAVVMGAAICGMHYTGMAAAIFAPHSLSSMTPQGINNVWLAAAIGTFVMLLLATTLLISMIDARARIEGRAAQEASTEAQAIIDAAYEAYIATDAESTILEWNRQAERTFGWSRTEAVGQNLAALLIPEQYREAHTRGVKHFLATGDGSLLNRRIEINALHRDGHEFPVELTLWPTQVGQAYKFNAFLHDISERQRSVRRLTALTTATAALVECTTLAEAAPKVLHAVGNALGWSGGALWIVDRTANTLRCAEFWHQDEAPIPALKEASRTMAFAPGIGIPGRVWSSGKAVWIANVTLDTNFPRAQSAVADGVRGAFGFPIVSDGKVLGVIEFFSFAIQEPDQDLLTMMDTLGILLGQFMERKQAESELEKNEQFLTTLLENLSEGIVACNEQGILTLFNRATRELHGLPEQPLPPEQWGEYYALYGADGETPLPMEQIPLFRAFRGEAVQSMEIVIAPTGRPRHTVVCNGQALVTPSGRKLGAVVAMHDITERKEAEQRLLQLAHYDTLTGLPNRRLYYESLQKALAHAKEQGLIVSVLFIDLDLFKNVNDTLGHTAGDELLRQFSNRLIKSLRVRDTIGRLGGDEFALALVTADDPQDAGTVANKIRELLRAPFELLGREVTVTASIGISVYPTDALNTDTLMKYADTAMYEAKAAGRDTYRFYKAEMNAHALEKLDLENALRKALEQNEFVLHYQPKLQINSGVWTGVEALIRWNRPGHGLVPPAAFIPALEETGLIVPVGSWVINAACRQISAWERSGMGSIRVAVNVSGKQFLREDLVTEVAQALRENSIDPALLEIEITESSLMSQAEKTNVILGKLKALGISISVDDFGTGYSSLAYLRRFPLDTLKIDIAFIRDITTDADDAAITAAIISMAHILKLKVVAEGVETREQLDFLRMHQCDEMQGYYLTRPLPALELARLHQQTLASPANLLTSL